MQKHLLKLLNLSREDIYEILDLAKYGSIPVINGLTDMAHPCQCRTTIHLGQVNKKI